MLYIIRADETLEELPTATSAEVEGDVLICREPEGKVVAQYAKREVLMFGHGERIRGYVKQGLDAQR